MITNDIIQAGLISKFKSISAITALVTNDQSVIEIREYFWQGTDFEFPAIRVRLVPTSPSIEGCEYNDFRFEIHVFSETASSKECSQIQSVIVNNLPNSFGYSSGGTDYLFSGIRVSRNGLGSPIRITERTWTNETMFQGRISVG